MLLLSAAAALVGGACDVRVGFEEATRSLKSCGFPRSVRLRRGPGAAFRVGSKVEAPSCMLVCYFRLLECTVPNASPRSKDACGKSRDKLIEYCWGG